MVERFGEEVACLEQRLDGGGRGLEVRGSQSNEFGWIG
jgi:hypothetical protein